MFDNYGPDDVLSCIEAIIRDELRLREVSNHIKSARMQLDEVDES